MLRHDWFYCAAEAFYAPDQLRVFLLESDGKIAAIAPLALSRPGLSARLEIIGSSHLFEPTGFIYRDEAALATLLPQILKQKTALVLQKVQFNSALRRSLHDLSRRRAFVAMREGRGSPWLPISTSWEAFESELSSRRRSDLRRAMRRAQSKGEVRFEFFAPTCDDVEAHLDAILSIEKESWKRHTGTDMSSDPAMERFFRAYSKCAARSGGLHVAFLKINQTPVAFQLAVEFKKRLWILKIGFDQAFSRCSPGMLLMHASIRRAFEARLEAVEFLGSDEPWLHIWTDHVHRQFTARIYPFSANGFLRTGIDACNYLSRKWNLRASS